MQLVLIISFYIAFLVLEIFLSYIVCPLLTGYNLAELRNADISSPSVIFTWKAIAFIDPIFVFLIPALLFSRLISPQPVECLNMKKPVELGQTLFVIVIVLLIMPMFGILYDWNYTWGIAQSSIRQSENMLAVSTMLLEMPTVGHLFINLLLFALVPAIARECFFRGVLQRIFTNMLPKTPWLAIIITAVLHGVSYFQWQWFAPAIFISTLFGCIYYFTENLWLAILGNFVSTSLKCFQSYFLQRGWSNEDPFYPSATPWYAALISLLLTAALLWYFRKRIPKPVTKIAYQEEVESIGK